MKLKIAIVLIATVVFLLVVLWGVDTDQAATALANTQWWMLLPMWGLYLVTHGLRIWRLHLLLGQPVPFFRLLSINSVGFLAINVIPLRLGELVRPYLLAEREGVPFGRGMAAIVLERLLDMVMLLGMLLGLAWFVDLPDGGLVIEGVDVIRAGQHLAGTIVALGAAAGGALVLIGEPAFALVEKLPMGVKLASFARTFRDGFRELAARPLHLSLLLALSAGVWLSTIAAVQVVMAAFPGVPATFGAAWSTWAITLAGMVALPTPGFFGAYELFCSTALRLWGTEADLAKTFAVVLHLGQFSFTVGLGAIFLVVEGLSLRDLVRPSDTAPPL